jgi:hypothetical protein
MWNVHSQHSSWNRSLLCLALELDFWLLFGYRSGPRPRNSVWLAPHDYRLARNDFHNCGFAESAGIQLKGSSNPISMQKVSAIAQWQGQQKNISEWKVSVGRSMHRVNWQHILGRSFLLLFHQPRPRKGYLHRRFLLSFIAQGQSKSKEKALQQPRLGAGRLLKIYTETVVRTAMSQKPAKTQTCFLTEFMWLEACQESFTQLQFCCEHWKGSTRIISEQKDSAIFQWQGQQKTSLSGLLPSIVPWQSLLSGFFLWFYPTGTLKVYIVYLHKKVSDIVHCVGPIKIKLDTHA